jgi:hypothetical protein
MTAGRARWVERMREAKAMGLIERFAGGRQPKAKPRVVKRRGKVIERARAVVARPRAEPPAVAVSPWNEQTHAEKLNTLTGMALDKTREILELPCDTQNLKLLSIQKDAALSILSTQTKVDDNRLRARETDMMPELLRRLAELDKADPKLIDNKPPDKVIG